MTLLRPVIARPAGVRASCPRPTDSPIHRVESSLLLHVRRWCAAVLAIAALAAPSARAQAVLGFGDDATTPPGGTVRLGFTNQWTRFEQRFFGPTGASITTRSLIRRTPVTLELGLFGRLSVGVTVPSVGTRVTATYFPDTASAVHADSVRDFGQTGVGDVEASMKLVWLQTVGERERYRPHGVQVRSALTGVVRFGTGRPPRPTSQFGIGTGDGQTDIEIGSQWDIIVGSHFWTSFVGRYGRQGADTRLVRVARPDDPFATGVGPVLARRELGDYYELEATPRLGLGEYFSLGAQYQYRHQARDTYTLAEPGATPDPSILNAGTELTVHRVGGGIVYSSVAAHAAGRTRYPFEITFQYFRILRRSDQGPTPGTYVVGARFYAPLWGRR